MMKTKEEEKIYIFLQISLHGLDMLGLIIEMVGRGFKPSPAKAPSGTC